MKVNTNVIMHDLDRVALQTLKSIPGFSALLKTYMSIFNERLFKLENMSGRVHITERQMSKYFYMLPPICEKLGIKEIPELFLELNPIPNAYTSGDTKPFIVITSGLLETLPDELIPTVLAHECGHIACHHVLYKTMGRIILNETYRLPKLTALVSLPLEMAFAYWMRCSEFSADRAAVICDGCADKMIEVCMRLAGADKDILADVSVEAFMEQAIEYKDLVNSSKWDKTLELYQFGFESHPLLSVRAYESKLWFDSEQYKKILRYLAGDEAVQLTDEELEREIPMLESSKYYLGKNYEEVRNMLIEEGFWNIFVEKSTDKGLLTKTNQTLKIRIEDKNSFEKGEWFSENAAIIITYYEAETQEEKEMNHKDEVQIPEMSRKYIGRNYKEVVQKLTETGFYDFNLEIQKVKKGLFVKENSVVHIEINGKSQFNKGDWFLIDSEVKIIYQSINEEE